MWLAEIGGHYEKWTEEWLEGNSRLRQADRLIGIPKELERLSISDLVRLLVKP
jgi:hypothetical protein